jgi:hypothetical protein
MIVNCALVPPVKPEVETHGIARLFAEEFNQSPAASTPMCAPAVSCGRAGEVHQVQKDFGVRRARRAVIHVVAASSVCG